MKRYFYTDPLAAAWMAKHFGMKIQIAYPGGALRDVPKQELLTTKPLDWMARSFFLHPDSLHLLEPKVGDGWIDTAGRLVYLIATAVPNGFKVRTMPFEGEAPHFMAISSLCNIDRRDGKHFMWPEVEAP